MSVSYPSNPVNVGNFPGIQQISGSLTGNVSVTNLPLIQAISGSISILNFPAIQPVSGTVSIDTKTGKTPVLVTGFVGTLSTSTVTIATYTVPAGKTFFLQFFEASVRRNPFAGAQNNFGQMFFNTSGGQYLWDACGPGYVEMNPVSLAEPLPFNAGTTLSWTVGPADNTGYVWEANFGGYLR